MAFFKKKNKQKMNEKVDVNKKETENNETTLEERYTSFKEGIMNEYIDFADSPKHGIIGDKYMKNLYLGITPNKVSFANFLEQLYTYGDIDTSIYIHPIDSETAKAELSKLRSNLEVEAETAVNSRNRAEDIQAKVNEAARLRSEVSEGNNKLYDVSFFATIYADSERELTNRANKFKGIMGQKDIGFKNAYYEQENLWRSNKPVMRNRFNIANDFVGLKRGLVHSFDKRSLASVFPFSTNNINHRRGVVIGFNKDNGLPIVFDNFDSSLANYNMVVFAKSGGGKSTFVKMLSSRSATLDNVKTISIDIEPEYRDIAETLGGINIDISKESKTIINPFEIKPEYVINKLTRRKHEVVKLDAKINSVTANILTMAKGFTNNNDEFYNDILRSIIKDAVKESYEKIGITTKVESLYERNQIGMTGDKISNSNKKLKELPTLSTWYEIVEEHKEKNTNETYKKSYDYLLLVIKDFCRVAGGTFTCFDGQSTVDIDDDYPFINFDVSELDENSELPLAQHIITDFIWETIVKKNDVKTNVNACKIRLIIDEAWRLCRVVNGEPQFPEALAFLDKAMRRARKKNTSTVIISQQFNEFYNDLTQSIIRNAETKMFLPPDDTSVDEIKEVFKLTEGEHSFLRTCTRGEGLMKCSGVSAKVNVDIPDFEKYFVETNQNVLMDLHMEDDDETIA